MNNPYRSYSKNQLDNACPGDQIAALFEKAAEHIANAGKAIDSDDVQGRYDYSQKTMAILEGLLACLNRDTPERAEAAASLEIYYKTMIMMISRVNIFNDKKTCESLESSFRDMAEFWRDAARQIAAQQNEAFAQANQPSNFMA